MHKSYEYCKREVLNYSNYSNLINDNKNDIKVLGDIFSKFFKTKNQRKSQENNEI